ncbi:GntR family transcriptional regulator [Undibacter mobilis]|uniref:GntR family transcriptional regulator n=1 Tax=Undibacter mobilis TaxID=2292256 RepID=A0A371B7M8_9BRAD|nr:GntR family transcriptional regulator [Undibacter mobilis]RDV03580.1 GntR family transcriptional regulator [Undibacter mobilis]
MSAARAAKVAEIDVTARLRDAITRGRLTPNERLIEVDLAEQFGVNRANIRMALAMLDQEGLVVREPNRGARVRAVSDDEAIEIAETRLAIEVMVAGRAALRGDAQGRARLKAIEKDMKQAIAQGDTMRYSQFNAALHRQLQSMAGNATADRILDTLKSHLVRLQYRVILLPGRPQASLAEHRAIVAAVCAGDGDAAERAMRQHLTSFIGLLRQAIDAARHGGF